MEFMVLKKSMLDALSASAAFLLRDDNAYTAYKGGPLSWHQRPACCFLYLSMRQQRKEKMPGGTIVVSHKEEIMPRDTLVVSHKDKNIPSVPSA